MTEDMHAYAELTLAPCFMAVLYNVDKTEIQGVA